jgi:GT2 family glycosyltransferase
MVAVIDVDPDSPVADLRCAREREPPYESALIFARRAGQPLGSVHIPLEGDRIPGAELERELARQLGRAWTVPVPVAPAATTLPSATIVVPTAMSRPEHLRACIARLVELDYPAYDVVVVDNRPAGNPVEYPGATVVREPRPGCSAARNRGLQAATGEIVAFVDDDIVVDPTRLRAMGERFAATPEIAAVTGMVLPAELETSAQVLFERSDNIGVRNYESLEFRREGRFHIRRRSLHDAVDQVYPLYATGELGSGGNMVFRTAVLRAISGFDVALGPGTGAPAGEDLEVLIRLIASGYTLAYEPRAMVHHTHRVDAEELDAQVHAYGTGLTAMLTSLVYRDPRHLLGLATMLPAALRLLRGHSHADRGDPLGPDAQRVAKVKLRGMIDGPIAYLRSRRAQRRWAA